MPPDIWAVKRAGGTEESALVTEATEEELKTATLQVEHAGRAARDRRRVFGPLATSDYCIADFMRKGEVQGVPTCARLQRHAHSGARGPGLWHAGIPSGRYKAPCVIVAMR